MNSIATKKIYSFIILLMFSIAYSDAQNDHPINAVIGDISFVKKFDHIPIPATDENLRIQTHLEYAENLLRRQDVSNLSPKLQRRRSHLLDLLHEYWIRGVFPRNYDYKSQRKPCFIDKDGRICAVGYLVEQTAGRDAAETINAKHKYDLIEEMDDEMIDDWIKKSGLTKKEFATIQPQYIPYCPCSTKPIPWATCVTNKGGQPKCKKYNRLAITGATLITSETSQTDTYTNPVSHRTTISILLDQPEKVSLRAFDMTGRLIATIADAAFKEGRNEIPWNPDELNPGIYLLQAQSAQSNQTVKLIITE